ncbi:alpha-amylase-related protein-like isoform X1 [Varroa destructor]|uniref:alpha-amylase n=2 Tax=Varroa TaxID=62624 RepID=A0A7M7KQX3_VARDE|nr:alpha-amylase-related protein-like isoform X1 [Varroa destructor]XP_022669495.1 alpha-amylase-related protein-like isoform X1 [Varroa destructor]XP_022669496.1 alpha-amylase-related protein-like isoform X1 [Varroa destructor]XP_022669497.1 alpha-amylase-related protein-like isoform X1 [Varroa destructor]XP_022669498.1 alpha-amylase-related protein-like isoform X1 [Varroa destructor]XP_022669499.1 alpha-amylase-related protein-like isoform X1 [Varroa destructor]XP_022669500.1 alpha-amylase-
MRIPGLRPPELIVCPIPIFVMAAVLLERTTPALARFWGTPNFYSTRTTIVHLDQWLYEDVGRECAEHLNRAQVAAVLVSAPNDHAFKTGRALDGVLQYRDYTERYQPVSFTKLDSASGTFGQFKRMARTCNDNNIRVYVDVVLGHTTSNVSRESYAHTAFDGKNLHFKDFKAGDFIPSGRCPTPSGNVEDYSDQTQLLWCRERGWLRLDLGSDNVQNVLGAYLQRLQLAGVTGFRVAYADRLDVYDLERVLDRLLPSTTIHNPQPLTPFIIIDAPLASQDRLQSLSSLGALVNSTLAKSIERILRRRDTWRTFSDDVQLWKPLPDKVFALPRHTRALAREDLTENFWQRVAIHMVTMFLPRGIPVIYSGWALEKPPALGINPAELGPPSSTDFDTLPVVSKKDGSCSGGWECIHRLGALSRIPQWRNVAGTSSAMNVRLDDDDTIISFARKGRSFVALATGEKAARGDFNTTLREGFYCDIISGERFFETTCTGDTYRVYDNHFVNILGESRIHRSRRLPIMAFHEESRTVSESENRQHVDEFENVVIA